MDWGLGWLADRFFLSVLLFALETVFGSLPPRLGSGKVCWNKILLGERAGAAIYNQGNDLVKLLLALPAPVVLVAATFAPGLAGNSCIRTVSALAVFFPLLPGFLPV